MSSCASHFSRVHPMDLKNLEYPCVDRDSDGRSDGVTQNTYPATRLNWNMLFGYRAGDKILPWVIFFIPNIIDLPISLVTDTLQYPKDKKSIADYKECMKKFKHIKLKEIHLPELIIP